MQKCLSLMDRGFAFRLVSIYLNTFRSDDSRLLYEFKFQFLIWICYHEHYIPLNLPRSANWSALRNSNKDLGNFDFLMLVIHSHAKFGCS